VVFAALFAVIVVGLIVEGFSFRTLERRAVAGVGQRN
jgi:hypothetical protein